MSTEVKSRSGGLDTTGYIAVNHSTKALFSKKDKKSPFLSKDDRDAIPEVDGKPSEQRHKKTEIGDDSIAVETAQCRIQAFRCNRALVKRRLTKAFSFKSMPTKVKPVGGQSEQHQHVARSLHTFAPKEFTLFYKLMKYIGFVAVGLMAFAGFFAALRMNGMASLKKGVGIVGAIWLILGFLATAAITTFFTIITVKKLIPMFKNGTYKTEAPLWGINTLVALLLVIFAILSIASVGGFTSWSKVDKLYKLEAYLGIVSGLSFYVTQFAVMHWNENYATAANEIKIKRSFLMTIAYDGFLCGLFLLLYFICWNKIGQPYLVKYCAGVLGVISMGMVIYAGLIVYNHFLIKKDPNFIRNIIIAGIVALLIFIFFVIVGAQTSTHTKHPLSRGFFIVVELFNVGAGVVAMLFSKKIPEFDKIGANKKPKEPKKEEPKPVTVEAK